MPAPLPSVKAVFDQAVELRSSAERRAYLDQACAADPELCRKVEALLRAYEEAGSFLEQPAVACPVATVDEVPISERPGTMIGPYKLLEQIGEGGMGVVFMAEQTQPVRRKVALKVIKPGMDTRQVVARFEAERQALALMDHPHIAHILDGGATASGRPYFVMELVRGIPITEFCDQNHLSVRERLALFVSVCQAVQHAHQKGIIHRDLKPSNVLVTLHDDKAVVKVIDFGIAKATGQQLTDKTLFTGFAQLLGTPLYMSPEQAQLSGLDVDTRSDIYSLGVLLYELLTGTTPFDKERLRTVGYDEIRRIIREEEPPRPSTRIRTLGLAATTVSTQRRSDARRLSQLFRGELDWIVMKCLEKDRDRRYDTANGLALDVQRYLHDEAVLACPPSAAYRLRKFVRRNKRPVLAASVILILLIGGVVGTSMGLFQALSAERHAIAAEKLASSNEAKARAAVNRYFTLISEETLLDMPGFQPLREKLLEEARNYYAELLGQRSSDPVLQAELTIAYFRMGEIYHATGKDKEFLSAFQTGVELAERIAEENPGSTDIHKRLAGFWKGNRRLHLSMRKDLAGTEAAATLQRVARVWQKFVDENPTVPEFQSDLAAVFSHISELYYEEPLQLLSWQEKAVGIRKKLVSAYPLKPAYRADLGTSHILLGIFSGRAGKREEAARHLRAAVKLFEELASEFTKMPIYRESLAIAKRFLSNQDGFLQSGEAIKLRRENLMLYGDLAAEFPNVPSYQHGHAEISFYVGDMLARAGQPQEAEKAYRFAAQTYSNLLEEFPNYGDYTWGVRVTYHALVNLLKSTGRSQEATVVSGQAIAFYEKLRAKFPNRVDFRAELGKAYSLRAGVHQGTGRREEAVDDLRKAVAELETVSAASRGPTNSASLAEYYVALGGLLGSADRRPEAEKAYRQAEEANRSAIALLEKLHADAPDNPAHQMNLGHSRWQLGYLLAATKRPAEAEESYREAQRIFEQLTHQLPHDTYYRLAHAWSWYGVLGPHFRNFGRLPEAAEAYRHALPLHEQLVVESSGELEYEKRLAGNYDALIQVLSAQHQHAEIEGVALRAIAFYEKLTAQAKGEARHRLGLALRNNNLGWMLATHPNPKVRDPKRAVQLAAKAVELAPTAGGYWNTLGAARYRAGEWKDAIATLQKAMDLGKGGNGFDWFFLAMAHWQLGEKNEARKWYDRAVEWIEKNQPGNEELRAFRAEAEQLLGSSKKKQAPK